MKLKMLPAVGPILLMLGPAFIWAATAQGSGELIWWPYLVARWGKAFLFLLLPSALLQYFVNREIGKYTVITGEGIWSGFMKLPKWWSYPLFAVCFVNFLWLGGYAISGGTSIWEIFKWPFDNKAGGTIWAYVLMAIFSFGLLYSKSVYKLLERMMKVVTAITMTGLLISAALTVNWQSLREFLDGLINPIHLGEGVNWQGFDYGQLISGIVFAGMGGFLNLMYSYWMKEKKVGMAGSKEDMFDDNAENQSRYKKWMRYLSADSGLAVTLNALTISLTSLLAFVLLWPERNYPQGWSITVAQSTFFSASFGVVGKIAFLLVAAAFLVDTWISLVDGVARQYADVSSRGKGEGAFDRHWRRWIWLLISVSAITIPLVQPSFLLKLTGIMSVFAFAAYIPGLWYLNYVKLPREYPKFVKGGAIEETCLTVSWALYTVLAILFVVTLLY